MAVDALAMQVARSSATMLLNIIYRKRGHYLPQGRIGTICAMSVLKNNKLCKYIFHKKNQYDKD